MGGLNTIGHAISNDKVNLDAGCKSLLGCTPVAAFIAKNCIPEFHDMALVDILPTAKAGGFLHQPPLRSNRGCCVLHDVRQALLPVCPTVRYVLV